MAMTEFHRRFSGLGAKPLGLQVWAISMRNIFGRWLLSTQLPEAALSHNAI